MRQMRWLTLLILLGAAAPVGAMTADELIAKNVEARGGQAKLKEIKSLKATGKATFGGGDSVREMAFTMLQKRPGFLRRERTLQGLTAITSFDGEVGWSLWPFGGRREPEKLPPDVVKTLRVDADIDGPLVDYKEKGHSVEYLGKEDVDGTDAHKLKVTLEDGDVQYVYLDPDYFLEIRVLSQEKLRGVEEESETDLGNYERVNGVYMPFSIETGPKGEPKNFKIVLQKVEANVALDDSLFHFPAPSPGPAR